MTQKRKPLGITAVGVISMMAASLLHPASAGATGMNWQPTDSTGRAGSYQPTGTQNPESRAMRASIINTWHTYTDEGGSLDLDFVNKGDVRITVTDPNGAEHTYCESAVTRDFIPSSPSPFPAFYNYSYDSCDPASFTNTPAGVWTITSSYPLQVDVTKDDLPPIGTPDQDQATAFIAGFGYYSQIPQSVYPPSNDPTRPFFHLAGFDRWVIQPKSASGESQPGRVWSDRFRASQHIDFGDNAVENQTADTTFYYLNNEGVQYRSDTVNYNGVNSLITADNVGLPDQCTSTYASEDLPEEADQQATQESNPADPRLADPSECPNVNPYRIFFEQPDDTMPTQAPSAAGQTWVYPEYDDSSPLTNAVYTRNSPAAWAGMLAYTSTTAGDGWLMVDIDSDGTHDVVTPITISEGANTASWDGKDADGNNVDIATDVTVQVVSKQSPVDEFHLVSTDIERRDSLSVTELVGPRAGTDGASDMRWNDSQLNTYGEGEPPTKCVEQPVPGNLPGVIDCKTARPPLTSGTNDTVAQATNPVLADQYALGGVPSSNSSSGLHGWNPQPIQNNETVDLASWGNFRYIEDWAGEFPSIEASVVDPKASVTLSKIATSETEDDQRVSAGDTVSYTLTATNTGAVDLPGATVTDSLADVLDDAEMVDDPQASAGTIVFNADDKSIRWIGDLAAEESVTITYQVKVNEYASLSSGATMRNTAVLDPNNDDACAAIEDNSTPCEAETETRIELVTTTIVPPVTVTTTTTTTETETPTSTPTVTTTQTTLVPTTNTTTSTETSYVPTPVTTTSTETSYVPTPVTTTSTETSYVPTPVTTTETTTASTTATSLVSTTTTESVTSTVTTTRLVDVLPSTGETAPPVPSSTVPGSLAGLGLGSLGPVLGSSSGSLSGSSSSGSVGSLLLILTVGGIVALGAGIASGVIGLPGLPVFGPPAPPAPPAPAPGPSVDNGRG